VSKEPKVREQRVVQGAFDQVPAVAYTDYFITLAGRTYLVRRYDERPGAAEFIQYHEGRSNGIHNFEFIPYATRHSARRCSLSPGSSASRRRTSGADIAASKWTATA
jgi:hypothetical protein